MADEREEVDSHDPHYEPIIKLPDVPVDMQTFEEDEDEIVKLRAKLFRFDASESPGEWKERGTGEVKLLRHKQSTRVRIVMRRDKTHKMCANHYITDTMSLIPSAGSERAWVWHTNADFADGEVKEERLAIRFANAEIAQKFKTHFDEGKVSYGAMENGDTKAETKSEDEGEDENVKDNETTKESPVAASGDATDAASAEDTSATDEVAEQLENVQISETNDGDEPSKEAEPSQEAESKPEAETQPEEES